MISVEKSWWPGVARFLDPGLRAFMAYRSLFLAIQGVAALFLVFYFLSAEVRRACDVLVAWKVAGGVWISALSCVISGGVIPELLKWKLRPPGLPNPTFVELLHQMGIFFICGLMVDRFYQLQAQWFGPAGGWEILLAKIFIDQFVYSFLIVNPLVVLWFLWREKGFSPGATLRSIRPGLVGERILPMWVTGMVFWIPLLLGLYSLPVGLQFVAFLFANCAWGILLVFIARRQIGLGQTASPPV